MVLMLAVLIFLIIYSYFDGVRIWARGTRRLLIRQSRGQWRCGDIPNPLATVASEAIDSVGNKAEIYQFFHRVDLGFGIVTRVSPKPGAPSCLYHFYDIYEIESCNTKEIYHKLIILIDLLLIWVSYLE